nr:MAG: innexin [Penaeus semisulcatus pemonivirus]
MSKLHYRVTTPVLLSFCLLVTTNTLVGDPISCVYDSSHPRLSDKVINTYCWIHTTFTLPHGIYGEEGTSPGIGSHKPSDSVTYHTYYQWIPFMLFIQGLMFYIPHYIWKNWEGGRLRSIAVDLSNPIVDKDDRRKRVRQLAKYLQSSLWYNNPYAVKYLFCEFLCVLNCQLTRRIEKTRWLRSFQESQNVQWLCMGSQELLKSLILCVFLRVPSMRERYLVYLLGHKHKSSAIMQTFNQIGDIFLIYLLKKNIECQSLDLLMTELSSRNMNNLKSSILEEEDVQVTNV